MMRRVGCGWPPGCGIPPYSGSSGVTSRSQEHSMRPVTRTIALFLLLIGMGTGQVAAQANPPPEGNPQGGPPPPNYPPPQGNPQPQARPSPQGQHFSSNEVLDAGHRFFGSVSRG